LVPADGPAAVPAGNQVAGASPSGPSPRAPFSRPNVAGEGRPVVLRGLLLDLDLVASGALLTAEERLTRVVAGGRLDVAEGVRDLEGAAVVEHDGHVDRPLVVGRGDDANLVRRGDGDRLGLLVPELHLCLRLSRLEAGAVDADFLTAGGRALRRVDGLDLERSAALGAGGDRDESSQGQGQTENTVHRA